MGMMRVWCQHCDNKLIWANSIEERDQLLREHMEKEHSSLIEPKESPKLDIEEMAARDERSMERIASALSMMALSFTTCVTLLQRVLDHDYPAKREARDVDLTHIPSDQDKLLEDLGATDEPLDEWIGLREQQVLDQGSQTSSSRRPSGTEKKRSRITPA